VTRTAVFVLGVVVGVLGTFAVGTVAILYSASLGTGVRRG
jgi:hypothetical protein